MKTETTASGKAFYVENTPGKAIGPYSGEQLKHWLSIGTLRYGQKFTVEGSEDWQELRVLFPPPLNYYPSENSEEVADNSPPTEANKHLLQIIGAIGFGCFILIILVNMQAASGTMMQMGVIFGIVFIICLLVGTCLAVLGAVLKKK